MHVLVTGSHGFIGSHLVPALVTGGHTVRRLVRNEPGVGEAFWDPRVGTLDVCTFDGIDAVIHLAGAGIGDKRWTPSYKQEVLRSRVEPTALLAQTMSQLTTKPAVFVSASAIGAYGDSGDDELDESATLGNDFLSEVCRQWEGATADAEASGIRVVNIRNGIVLSPQGGALQRMLLPFKLGVGGRMGSGRAWWSWISIDDEIGAIVHCLTTDALTGPVNLTAPHPVTNAAFTKTLGRVLRRPTLIPTPRFAMNAILGKELAGALLMTSIKARPAKLLAAGYIFEHNALNEALHDLLDR